MSRVAYEEILQFKDHQNSINAVAFSPDGRHLATGGDNGLLFVFDPFTGKVVHKLEGQAPVTAVCWDPHDAGRLFVGYGTGRVLVAQTNSTPLSAHYLPRSTCDEPVEDLMCDIFNEIHRILICAGSRVELWKEVETLRWVETCLEPPEFIVTHARQGSSSELVARSGHIVNDGSLAVITYLNHGIVCWNIASRAKFQWHMLPRTTRLGRSAVSSDGKLLAASNLYDGFDLYSLETRKHAFTCPRQITLNVPLPVLMTSDGTELITGTSCGWPTIFDPTTGNEKAVLDHSDDIVQALAYCDFNGTRLLATGTSERGDATLVRVWRREVGSPSKGGGSREHLGCVLVARVYRTMAQWAISAVRIFVRLAVQVCRYCWGYFFHDKKILGISMVMLLLTVLVGTIYEDTVVSKDLGLWNEPTSESDRGLWITLAYRVSGILLKLVRYASRGSRVIGTTGSDIVMFSATWAVDASVAVAQISVRILTGYIVYVRGAE